METKKVWWMIKKDLLTLWRHKVQFVSLVLFPILMIALCGWGMGGTVENTPVVIVKQTTGDVTDQVINAIKADKTFEVKDILSDPDEAKRMVDNGEVRSAIILSSNFEDEGTRNAILYIDSSDQMTTQMVIPTTQRIFASLSEQIEMSKISSLNRNVGFFEATSQSIKLQINKIYGDIEYIDYLLPGVLAMTMFMSSMLGLGNSIAGERERGELARLFMTPTSISSVLLDIKKELISNIFICGGNSLIFNNYFNDIKESIGKELISGSLVKLTTHPSKIERSLSSFLGASIISSLNIYKETIVKKEEYEEHGAIIIEKKCA